MTEKPTIFLSYRREDGPDRARFVHDILSSMGADVFFDPDHMDIDHMDDDPHTEVIKQQLLTHDIFLLLLNPHTLQSAWVRREIELARQNQRNILLLTMQDFRMRDHLPADMAFLKEYRTVKYDHVDPNKSFERLRKILFRTDWMVQSQSMMQTMGRRISVWVFGVIATIIVAIAILIILLTS
ncbi:MAG: hypothetical protein OHK0046_32880 [Anaerolineae bacterium]